MLLRESALQRRALCAAMSQIQEFVFFVWFVV